jgi:hypothetical protein
MERAFKGYLDFKDLCGFQLELPSQESWDLYAVPLLQNGFEANGLC